MPSPKLQSHYPNLADEWVNFYDKADVIGYPLKELNADYRREVSSDCPVLALHISSTLVFDAVWRVLDPF
jgi:hypothetical protein